ncbi:host specificity protein J, partial [Burkholderia cenocepacia]
GYVDQTHIAGFESSVAETQVGVALTTQQPWSHTFTNVDLSAARITLSVSGLSKTDTNTGNIYGYRVAYQIQVSKDGGSFSTVIDTAFDGKASSTYTRSHRIELSGAKSQYTVRVVRLTPDGTTQYIQDKTSVVSYAEVIDAKLSYPYSALVALQIDAEQFSSMPTRAYDVLGLLVKYPSNYNPKTRVYTGTWDGTFSFGWTDNPAWIFYDLVLNKRYGLGRYVDATMLDRYALYQIGRYCDVLVSDGKGGQEPRFTCNCYIASRADAIKVIQDLASVFRGIAYWSAGSVTASADMPSDPVYVYTAANVVKGEFKYVGSSLRTRYTTALVTYNDPGNAYKQTVEYVEDADGINRYGINKAEVTAFGCTSRSQAQRVGQWSLLTSRYETNAVT